MWTRQEPSSHLLPGPGLHSKEDYPDITNTLSPKRAFSKCTSLLTRRGIARLFLGVFSFWLLTTFLQFRYGSRQEDDVWIDTSDTSGTGEDVGGILVGSNGVLHGIAKEEMETLSISKLQYIDPQDMVHGLPKFMPNVPLKVPSSGLGKEADASYLDGPRDMTEYRAHLEAFIANHLPESLRQVTLDSINRFLSGKVEDLSVIGQPATTRNIWMTDRDESRMAHEDVRSWKDNKDGWNVKFMDDDAADRHVKKWLSKTRLDDVWHSLPSGILRSDMLRYLVLFLHGGIYTDLDTHLLRPIPEWSSHFDLYNNGQDWLWTSRTAPTPDEIERMKLDLPQPSIIIGIETDVGDRPDWHDWWPRPLQIIQWTMASAPHHPIFLDVLLTITRATAHAYQWAMEHDDDGTMIIAEPSQGGPLGVMEWTGPGIWTDAVIRYLRVRHGVRWTDLRGLKEPVRLGEVLILPQRGFSPSSQETRDHNAMVQHKFAGTWKNEHSR